MIIAIDTDTGERVAARLAQRGDTFRCPACDAHPLTLKRGTLKVPHFAHPAGGSCDHEPESWEHIQGKEALANHYDGHLEAPIRSWTSRRRADVLCGPSLICELILHFDANPDHQWSTHKGFSDERDAWITEYQCSRLTFAEWRHRTTDYNAAGYPVLWVWGTDRLPRWDSDGYTLERALATNADELESILHYGSWILA